MCSTVGGVQYRGGYHEYRGGYLEYRRGCSVPWGDIMINVGDILSTVGVFSTVGDIMSTGGVILSTVGMFSTVGDIMMHVGGYHEYRGGCSVLWGGSQLLFEYPTVLNTPHGTHDIPPHAS